MLYNVGNQNKNSLPIQTITAANTCSGKKKNVINITRTLNY